MGKLQVPQSDPILREKFILNDLENNNNKYWMVEVWDNGILRTTYGRVDSTQQETVKYGGLSLAHSLINQKEKKGYKPVDLLVPTTTTSNGISGPLGNIVKDIFTEAGEYIQGYLSVGVNELSQVQIKKGRQILDDVQRSWQAHLAHSYPWEDVVANVQAFFNTIPTKLPARINRDDVTRRFVENLAEMEDRLNQLEAAVAGMTVQASGGSVAAVVGAHLSFLPESDEMYDRILSYIERTSVHGYKIRVKNILTVEIPRERMDFEDETFGKNNIQLLWHGTRAPNVRHILRTGLIIPRMAANGSMFGRGIYFANKVSKSANYSSSNRLPYRFLFLADVAVGLPWVAPDADQSLSTPPRGYHSVWGKAGHTGSWSGRLQYDEFIIYRTSQQTIRYIVTFQ